MRTNALISLYVHVVVFLQIQKQTAALEIL